MSVFEDGMAALFEDPNGAVDATYTPDGGSAIEGVRLIVAAPDDIADVLDVSLVQANLIAEVQIVDVADPQDGDAVTINDGPAAGAYVVHGKPVRDSQRLVWRLGLDEV